MLVHGGAWDIPQDETDAHKEGMLHALDVARDLLLSGCTALDAAAEAVAVLERHPAFDAGTGAVLNRLVREGPVQPR